MFFNDEEIRQNGDFGYGEDINIDINNVNTNTNTNTNFNTNTFDMNMSDPGLTMIGYVQGPIIEPGRERVIQRNIVHEVKQYIPLLNNIRCSKISTLGDFCPFF